MANSIKIWKTVERRIGGPFKFCNSTPLWHNFNFVCGNRPFVQPSWSSLGVNTCGDMYDNQGLCSFQALRATFCLPASAYFVFLQLRSALKAYGVPWSSSISSHPMRDWIAPSAGRPYVSLIYNKMIDCITKPLSIKTIWNRELSDLNLSVDWERVWSNLSLTSKNLAHRLIHFKVIHRAYITPYKRFKMKLQSNLNGHICNTTSSGTFLHMFWECPVVISLWTHVNLVLSSLLRIDWSVNPSLCLLNDDSDLCISSMQNVVCWFYSCEEDNNKIVPTFPEFRVLSIDRSTVLFYLSIVPLFYLSFYYSIVLSFCCSIYHLSLYLSIVLSMYCSASIYLSFVRSFPAGISTLIHRWINVGYHGWINVGLCFDFANWINVDIVTLFHRWNRDVVSPSYLQHWWIKVVL